MTDQLRTYERPRSTGTPEDGTPGHDLGEVRDRAQAFLTAGGDAIAQALSGDSQSFLNASRQRGGQ